MRPKQNKWKVSFFKPAKYLVLTAALYLIALMAIESRGRDITVLVGLSVLLFFEIDRVFKYYTFDADGVRQHWFFHTDFFPWSSFQEIFLIERGREADPKYFHCRICMDRGVRRRMSSAVDQALHPFRMIVIELTVNGGPGPLYWWADREQLLSFLDDLGITPEVKPYGGFLSDD